MQAQSSGDMFRQLFGKIIRERLRWTSGRTIIPKRKFSAGSSGRSSAHPRPNDRTSLSTAVGSGGLLTKVGLNTQVSTLAMVRRVEGIGGLRHMGIIERPAARAAQHGVRNILPTSDEERYTEEFLKEEKRKQAEKLMKTEKAVGGVAGQPLAATDAEFVRHLGRNTADIQKDIAQEKTRKSEVEPQEGSGHLSDRHFAHPDVDEDVKRGLVADSALPIGRTEKTDEDMNPAFNEAEHQAEIKVGYSEHGSFKAL